MKTHSPFHQFLRKTKRSLERNLERFTYRRRLNDLQAQAEEITANHSGHQPVVLFAPGLSWNRQLVQRPQQLAKALADLGCLVYFLEPRPQFSQAQFTEERKNLFWANVPANTFATTPDLWLYQLTWSIDVSPYLQQPKIWYDVVDDLSTFRGDPAELVRNHEDRIKRSTLLTVTARTLFDDIVASKPEAILSPNAVDIAHFSRIPAVAPVDIEPILATRKPLIGYHGAFDRWFDYALLLDVARRESCANFLLIGPDVQGHLQQSSVLNLENVYWLGEKSYESLPNYLYFFDVAIIPFILSPITHATSPIKMFEYMAMGKSIVATAMHEILQYPEVLAGRGTEDFLDLIRQALSSKDEPKIRLQMIKRARENSWQSRADSILQKMRESGPTTEASL